MIAVKNVIIDEISAMQLLPVLINGLPHLTCLVVQYPTPSEWWRCEGTPHICNSQVTHQGLMTGKKDIQKSCAKKVHTLDGQIRVSKILQLMTAGHRCCKKNCQSVL